MQGDTAAQITSREYLDPEDLTHFGLAADPFDDPLGVSEPYLSPPLRAFEAVLRRAMAGRQIVALAGEPGSGKTTLVRRLLSGLDRRTMAVEPASLDRRRVTANTLAVAIIRDLVGKDTSGLSPEQRSVMLRDVLASKVREGLTPIMIIDEAHLLRSDALLALKHLYDAHVAYRLIGILLVGHPALEARLRREPGLRELTGRTRILRMPLLGQHTGTYLSHLFAAAGADSEKIFTPAAVDGLSKRGQVPLWINNAAVLAMQYARRVGDTVVDATHVGRA